MDIEVEVIRKFRLTFTDEEIICLLRWYESPNDEKTEKDDRLFSQLNSLRPGKDNAEYIATPASNKDGDSEAPSPAMFARLRQSRASQAGNLVVGGEWIERD